VASLRLEREAYLLIELSNKSDFKDLFGRTPLSWAARNSRLIIV
jgi:ankyrin repeat protein